MIWTELSEDDIGKDVIFDKDTDWEERGKLKSFNNETKIAWVVYHCGDDWDNFQNYTGQSSTYRELTIIINEDDCDHDYRDASFKWGDPNRK